MKYKPLKCQEAGLTFALKNPACGLLAHMGVGKTVTVLTLLNKLMYNYLTVRRALIIAPLRVTKITWPNEIQKWAHTKGLTYTVLHGTKKNELIQDCFSTDITLVNYEGLMWLNNNRDKFPRYDIVIADESTFIKGYNTSRTKIAHAISRFIPRKIILTGSPTPNSMEDLWAQIYFLDRGKRLGASMTDFRDTYFNSDSNPYSGKTYYLKAGAKDQIIDAIRDIVMVVTSDEIPDLPPIVENEVPMELPKKLRKRYSELESDFITLFESGYTLEALNQQARTQKLRQLLSGFVYDEEATTRVVRLHKEKLKVLKELITSLSGHNVLVAYQFKEEVEMIREYWGKPIPIIGKDKGSVEAWTEGKISMGLVHPASVAHGLNMQDGGSHIIWYSGTWASDEDSQLTARLRRRGQKADKVFCHRILVADTIDTVINRVVRTKKSNQKTLLKKLKER